VVALADVFRRFADDYLSRHGASVLPSHRRAIADILACRTHALGGHLWRCNHCSSEVYSYHSCKNRSCPRCHKDQTERWIAAREVELLACPYFHVTVTVPAQLREVLRANQRDGYAALMKATAEAVIELARDRRHVGGTVGVMAVLHTWTQQLVYHPHVHCLVTGAGVSDDGLDWHPARDNFLVPTRPLAVLVRAKMRAALAKRRPDLVLPKAAWRKPWVIHCTAWGDGAEAVLRYLARYVFRVAITEGRIVGLDDDGVTIRHKHRASGRWHTTRLSGHEFMRRFLQHVLPKGLHKVRYSGLWHHSRRDHAARARQLLAARSVASPRTEAESRRSRCYGESSIAVLGAAPLPVLQGRPPRVCAQALPQTGTWTMTRWNERQRLRLRVPVTPQIAAAHTLPFSGAPARTACDASAITRPNHRARHYRTAAQPRAPRETAITSLRRHLENP
jgi:Putative transposase/Transposase zinc-binding domain